MDCFFAIGCFCLIVLVLFISGFGCFVATADADATLLLYSKIGCINHLSGQVAWITGASSGIGEHLAYDLAALGLRLAISGVRTEKLEDVKKYCLEHSSLKDDDILVVPFHIEDFEFHDELVRKVIDHFGHIDILVNNAGMSQRSDFQDIEVSVDHKLFDVNVFGPVNLTRKVLQHFMERKKGQIIVNSSLAGKIGAPYSATYSGSKHALQGYFESLRTETIQTNISVTIVYPGPVFSGITDRCVTGKLGEIANQKQLPTDKKMKTSRCSQLMVVAIANKLDECWICLPPLLGVYYLSQYTPSFFKNVILKKFFSRERATSLRQGQD